MAVLASNFPTLLDLAKISDTDGKVTSVIEILNESNPVLEDMPFKEGNLPTGERTTLRAMLPKPTWRSYNEFVQPTKGQTAQVTFNCGMLEAFGEVDCALADLNGNTAAFRASEDKAHIEGMGQEMATTIFYGDEGDEPAAFTGLGAYYGSTSGSTGDNVIDGKNCWNGTTAAAAANNLSSVWLVNWGEGIQGIVPKGSMAGMQSNDLGKTLIQGTSDTSTHRDASPGRMMAYVTHYRQDAGLAVRDWRNAVRIANVSQEIAGDQSAQSTTSGAPGFTTLPELMFQAYVRLENGESGRKVWYMSKPVLMKFAQQLTRMVSQSSLSTGMVGGKMITSWMGMPIKVVDALSGGQSTAAGRNEALVT